MSRCQAPGHGWRRLDRDALLPQGELGELVPVLLDQRRHVLLLEDDLRRRVRGLLVAYLGGDPTQQLVARDLQVLRGITLAGVAARLLAAYEVERHLGERAEHAADLLHGGR